MAIQEKNMTPKEVVAALDLYIVGQKEAKKSVAVALRNRYRRLQLDKKMQKEITPKNLLMIGPTGVGKTEIARRLANLVQAPFAKVEATKFTEVGYVGRDVESMVRDLVEDAVRIVERSKKEEVRPQAYAKAIDQLAKVLKPGLKKKVSNPQQDSLKMMFSSMGIPQPNFPNEEEEEVTQEIASTREAIKQQLKAGLLNQMEVTIELTEKPLQMNNPNAPEQMIQLQSMLDSMTPKKKTKRTVTVEEAIELLTQEEADHLVNKDDIHAKAVELAETSGIIFIDEIDKIAISGQANGGQVSREGVQRDILPIVEGSSVNTKYGVIKTDYILFIASGAFHVAKPSDLMPELQGRFPIRVELQDLTKEDFKQILTEPKNSLLKQYKALLNTEDVEVTFTKEAVEKLAELAFDINSRTENIGARRLHTILEKLLEDLLFEAPEMAGTQIQITQDYVVEKLGEISHSEDLSRYIL